MADPILNSATQVQPTVIAPPIEQPKKSGTFGRIMGGVMGGALNLVAPGLGTVLGGALSGGGASTADMQTMMDRQMQQSMNLLSVQNRVQSQSQEFTTFSNLLKSKHDSEMSAVTNFKT